MKDLGPVSNEEMAARFPGLMAALSADPETVTYCGNCDGLRVFADARCTSCGWSVCRNCDSRWEEHLKSGRRGQKDGACCQICHYKCETCEGPIA